MHHVLRAAEIRFAGTAGASGFERAAPVDRRLRSGEEDVRVTAGEPVPVPEGRAARLAPGACATWIEFATPIPRGPARVRRPFRMSEDDIAVDEPKVGAGG